VHARQFFGESTDSTVDQVIDSLLTRTKTSWRGARESHGKVGMLAKVVENNRR
jgi:hypothetical protein